MTSTQAERIFASPLAKRLAREWNLDLKQVEGSGPRGRIVRRDVEEQRTAAPIGTTQQETPLDAPYTVTKLTNMRKSVARRLTESKSQVPHFYLTKTVRIDRMLAVRKAINDQADGAYKISVNDFIIKAVAMAMAKIPEINVTWDEAGIRSYQRVDLAVAVAVKGGLLTPVLRNLDHRGLAEISNEMKDLIKKAQDGKLQPHEYTGGAMSISNLGMYGIDHFQAILNPPQASILAVGQGKVVPSFNEKGEVEAQTQMCLTLSVDHRAVDGALGAKFLLALEQFLGEPATMLV